MGNERTKKANTDSLMMGNVGSHRQDPRVKGQKRSDRVTRVSQGPWLTCISKGVSKRAGAMEKRMLLISLVKAAWENCPVLLSTPRPPIAMSHDEQPF